MAGLAQLQHTWLNDSVVLKALDCALVHQVYDTVEQRRFVSCETHRQVVEDEIVHIVHACRDAAHNRLCGNDELVPTSNQDRQLAGTGNRRRRVNVRSFQGSGSCLPPNVFEAETEWVMWGNETCPFYF